MGFVSHLCGGRHDAIRRDDLLPEGQHCIVGIPWLLEGRARRIQMHFGDVRMVTLDRVDEMMSRGGEESIYGLLAAVPPSAQICLFSEVATPEVSLLKDHVVDSRLR